MLVWNGITKNFSFWGPVLGLGLGLFGIYAFLAPTAPTGIADSDEIVALGYGFKAAHPPGYALETLLIFLGTRLVKAVQVYKTANVLNAGFMAGAVTVWWIAVSKILKDFKEQTLVRTVSWLMALALGLTLPYLVYGAVTEVLALLILLTGLSWLAVIKVYQEKSVSAWYSWCALITLAIFHHQLAILTLPGMAILLWPFWKSKVKQRNITVLVWGLAIIMVTLSLAGLLLAYELRSVTGWHWLKSDGLAGLASYFARDIYSGVNVEARGVIYGLWQPGIWKSLWPNTLAYLSEFVQDQMSWTGLLLAGAGMVFGWKRLPKHIFWAIIMELLLLALALGAYLHIPRGDEGTIVLTERMWLTGMTWWWLWLTLGVMGVLTKLNNKYIKLGFGLILGVILIWKSWQNITEMRAIAATPWWQYLSQNLNKLPNHARVICLGDVSCFSLMAWQEIYTGNPTVEAVPITSNLMPKNYGQVRSFGYPDNPFRLDEAISQARANKQPVYYFENSAFYQNHWQLNQGGFTVKTQALIKNLECNDLNEVGVLEVYKPLKIAGQSHIQQFRREWLQGQFKQIGQNKPCTNPKENFEQANTCLKLGQTNCALREGMNLIQKEPMVTKNRIMLAKILEQAGLLSLAKREYLISSELEPQNPEAAQALVRLAQIEDLGLHQIYFNQNPQ